jgi:hypothetical protein
LDGLIVPAHLILRILDGEELEERRSEEGSCCGGGGKGAHGRQEPPPPPLPIDDSDDVIGWVFSATYLLTPPTSELETE